MKSEKDIACINCGLKRKDLSESNRRRPFSKGRCHNCYSCWRRKTLSDRSSLHNKEHCQCGVKTEVGDQCVACFDKDYNENHRPDLKKACANRQNKQNTLLTEGIDCRVCKKSANEIIEATGRRHAFFIKSKICANCYYKIYRDKKKSQGRTN